MAGTMEPWAQSTEARFAEYVDALTSGLCHVAVPRARSVGTSGIVRPLRLQSASGHRDTAKHAVGTVTLPREERDISRPLGMSGRCDRGPPRGHRRSAKRAVRLG